MSRQKDRTRLYIVCSPLGGTGKTLTARLLLDHALRTASKAQGFDTNHLDPDLDRMYPLATSVTDISAVRGQMAFFDRLVVADGVPKIVDLWHGAYDLFWAQAESLGFFAEARAQGVEPIVFLQADRKNRFLHELKALPARAPNLANVLVHNKALAGSNTGAGDEGRLALVGARRLLIIPEFDAATRRVLETPGTLAKGLSRALPSDGASGAAASAQLKTVFDQLAFIELTAGVG